MLLLKGNISAFLTSACIPHLWIVDYSLTVVCEDVCLKWYWCSYAFCWFISPELALLPLMNEWKHLTEFMLACDEGSFLCCEKSWKHCNRFKGGLVEMLKLE